MSLGKRFKRATVNFFRELAGRPTTSPPIETLRYIHTEVDPDMVADNQLLAGKNALISGSGQNVGRSILHELAKQGANVFFFDLNPETITTLEQELAGYPVRAKGFTVDITCQGDIDSLVEQLTHENINIDILVNNVGTQFLTEKGIQNFKLEEWRTTFDTNLFGPVYLTKCIAQTMRDANSPGTIIFLSSIHQEVVFGWPSYSASKAALGMVIKELALDLAPHHIRVNGIAPGWVAEDEQANPLLHRFTPLHNSSIKPAYIGRAVVYLAAEYFSHMTTGTILTIDGGLSLHSYLSLMGE